MNDKLTLLLEREYRMLVTADPEGGYVVEFPDLPGCMTQMETLEELSTMASDAKRLWIESMLAQGRAIPVPTYPEEFSGKFNVRLPKSLHRALVDQAESEGVSLNQLVVSKLSREQVSIEGSMRQLLAAIAALDTRLELINRDDASLTDIPKRRSKLAS